MAKTTTSAADRSFPTPVNRRTFLTRATLVAGTVAVSGCSARALEEMEAKPPAVDHYDETSVDLPVSQKSDVADEATRRAEGSTFGDLEALRTYFEEQELVVDTLEEVEEGGERILEAEYADERVTDRGGLYGLGVLAGGYAALLGGEYEGDRLAATIVTPEGEPFGEFEIQADLAERYREGELSAAAYAGMVADTLASTA